MEVLRSTFVHTELREVLILIGSERLGASAKRVNYNLEEGIIMYWSVHFPFLIPFPIIIIYEQIIYTTMILITNLNSWIHYHGDKKSY
jgi:hypothetical protein